MKNAKIYVIGLPRTGTTSFCAAMLDLGFKVAHTAYTPACMKTAQVIADTPVFCDYQSLDALHAGAKFIYLQRALPLWIPSIRQLLQRMHKNITRTDGGFNPILKRCFQGVFSPFTLDNFASDDFLASCYHRHQQSIDAYFKDRSDDLLSLDISQPNSYERLLSFLQIDAPVKNFEPMNIGGKITAWNKIKHPLKVAANLKT